VVTGHGGGGWGARGGNGRDGPRRGLDLPTQVEALGAEMDRNSGMTMTMMEMTARAGMAITEMAMSGMKSRS